VADQPFAGVNVVEFGQFVAVPYCAQLLADGGAHVIKVEPHEGDPTRALAPVVPGETRHFLSRNRGKHSLPLDLRHEMAPAIIDALLAKADVALFNLRPGLAEALGLDYATLSRKYPSLIVGTVTAFGKRGPDSGLAGMDYVVQARSGLMLALGKTTDGMPSAGESPIVDYMCAMTLAFGVSSALFRRSQTGHGAEVDVSLLAASMTLQATLFTRIASLDAEPDAEFLRWLGDARKTGVPFAEQIARSSGVRPSYMTTVYYRTYQTADGAIGVACGSPQLRRKLMLAAGREDAMLERMNTAPRDEIAAHYAALQLQMEELFRTRTSAEWQSALDAHGVPASRVTFPAELLQDAQVDANGLLQRYEHWGLGPVTVLGVPLTMDGDGFRPGPATAAFGSESRAILGAIGLPGDVADRAIATGAVREPAESA
jgi:CoA:oxalate CoA-transferase